MSKRFTIEEHPNDIRDNMTGELYEMNSYYPNIERICDLLNKESERADHNAELCTDEGLLKLQWELSIYKRFSEETLKVLGKYHIKDLEKLDKCLFEQRVW